jgi:hypothetical protein
VKTRRFYSTFVTALAITLLASPLAHASTGSTVGIKAKKKKIAVQYAYSQDGIRAACTIVGTSGKNKLNGTAGDDVICGLGGNDKIDGGGGNDIIDGGMGKDSISGGPGDDIVVGGEGNDTLTGSDGIDEVLGGGGNDKVGGGTGDDFLAGDSGKDALSGDEGDDELNGGAGRDTMTGGNGSNTCTKDTMDRGVYGCFFDNSDPTVSDIWVSTPAIDTSTGPQNFSVYVQLQDLTGGFPIYSIWGNSPINLNLSRIQIDEMGNEQILPGINLSGMATTASCGKVARWRASMPAGSIMPQVMGCRVAGGRLNPLLKFDYTMPQYSRPGSYLVTNLTVWDAARNSASYQYKPTNNCTGCTYGPPGVIPNWINEKFDIGRMTIKQVGPGDIAGPSINSISYQSSVDTTSGDAVIDVVVRASDDIGFGTGLWSSAVNVNFTNVNTLNQQISSSPSGSLHGSAMGAMCDSIPSYMANNQMGCQSSPGVFVVKVRVPQGATDGEYRLTNISVSDGVGNYTNAHYCTGCQPGPGFLDISSIPGYTALVKSGYVSRGDSAAPVLISMTMETARINTAGGPASAIATVTVRDSGGFSGNMPPVNLQFSVDGVMNWSNSFWGGVSYYNNSIMTCAQLAAIPGGPGYDPIGSQGCLLSQSGGDYTFRIPIRLVEHAKSGTYKLIQLQTSDGVNSLNYVPRGAPFHMGVPTYFEDVLGTTPSFVNDYPL